MVPIDFHIFQRGRSTTIQLYYAYTSNKPLTTINFGKPPFLMGKLTINGNFQPLKVELAFSRHLFFGILRTHRTGLQRQCHLGAVAVKGEP